jgi:hypothetical protein
VVKFVADDLGLPIVGKNPTPPPRLKDRFSWPEHLREALLMLPFGHMYFEQVYRVDEGGDRRTCGSWRPAVEDDRAYRRRPRRRADLDHPVLDVEARPPSRSRWTGWSPTSTPGGRQLARQRRLLRNGYKNWLIKDRLLRVQAQTIERNGMGIPLYKGQEGASEVTT